MSDKQGWYAFDLDGTLAYYDHWRGTDNIGKPIPNMVDLAKKLISEGKEVRVFTARVDGVFDVEGNEWDKYFRDLTSEDTDDEIDRVVCIRNWCLEHIGKILVVTNRKDFGMIELYDDRCFHVEKNTGKILG